MSRASTQHKALGLAPLKFPATDLESPGGFWRLLAADLNVACES